MSASPDARRWHRPIREHREAVAAFVRVMERIPPERWERPIGRDGWTPAQIAEHILLTYRVPLAELAGGLPMRRRTGPLMQHLLRWFLLPHILFHRSIPVRAPAPREIRPSERGLGREVAARELRAAAEELERRMTEAEPGFRFIHPYFGPIPLPRALRFAAAHTDHHRRQIERAASSYA